MNGPLAPGDIVIGPTADASYDEPVTPPTPTEAPVPTEAPAPQPQG